MELSWYWNVEHGKGAVVLAALDTSTRVESVWIDKRLASRSPAGGKRDGHAFSLGAGGAPAQGAGSGQVVVRFDQAAQTCELRIDGVLLKPAGGIGARFMAMPLWVRLVGGLCFCLPFATLGGILPIAIGAACGVGVLVLAERRDVPTVAKVLGCAILFLGCWSYVPFVTLRLKLADVRHLPRQIVTSYRRGKAIPTAPCRLEPGRVYLRTGMGTFDVELPEADALCVDKPLLWANVLAVRSTDGAVFYVDEGGVHQAMQSGLAWSGEQWEPIDGKDDPRVPTPACEVNGRFDGVAKLAVPGDARGIVYACRSTPTTLHRDGSADVTGVLEILAAAPSGRLVVTTKSLRAFGVVVSTIDDSGMRVVEGIPELPRNELSAARAVGDDLLVMGSVLGSDKRYTRNLWRVDASGHAALVATYAERPGSTNNPGAVALDRDGNVFEMRSLMLARVPASGQPTRSVFQSEPEPTRQDYGSPPHLRAGAFYLRGRAFLLAP